jgi:DNA adenine methylase
VRYVGGKARIAKWIRDHVLAVADKYRGVDLTYVEPFVGSGAVLEQIVKTRRFARHIANDIHPDLIRMWHALSREGWSPPLYLDKEEYKALQNSRVSSALRGYAGFACSFGGKFFGGHEKRVGRGRNKCDGQGIERSHVLRAARLLRGVELKNADYSDLVIPPYSIVYCDPPYAETQGYDSGDFDHRRFWTTMNQWVKDGAIVLVSEYDGPWPVHDELGRQSVLAHTMGGDRRVERLFMRRP